MHLLDDINVAIWLLGNSPLELDDDLEVYFLGYEPYMWPPELPEGMPLRDSAHRDANLEDLIEEGYDITLGDLVADLRELQIVPLDLSENVPTGMAVVGRKGWTEEELINLLKIHAGSKIRVYSEEMFVAYLLTGHDPFDGDQDLLRSFGVGHPALEFLMTLEVGFDWPTTIVSPRFGSGEQPDFDWSKNSLPGILGYQVGKNSMLSTEQRRRILDRTMATQFTPAMIARLGSDYLDQWGEPRSSVRLRKLALWMASFCKLNKLQMLRSGQDFGLAIEQREADLVWLKNKYYQGHFRFWWPTTDVQES